MHSMAETAMPKPKRMTSAANISVMTPAACAAKPAKPTERSQAGATASGAFRTFTIPAPQTRYARAAITSKISLSIMTEKLPKKNFVLHQGGPRAGAERSGRVL